MRDPVAGVTLLSATIMSIGAVLFVAALVIASGGPDRGRCLVSEDLPVMTFVSMGGGMIPITTWVETCTHWEYPEGRP